MIGICFHCMRYEVNRYCLCYAVLIARQCLLLYCGDSKESHHSVCNLLRTCFDISSALLSAINLRGGLLAKKKLLT